MLLLLGVACTFHLQDRLPLNESCIIKVEISLKNQSTINNKNKSISLTELKDSKELPFVSWLIIVKA